MGKTVAIANQKGGVGKTTTAVNLCAGLAYRGRRVLLVDCDPQGNATTGFGLRKGEIPSIYDVMLRDMPAREAVTVTRFGDILGASPDLAGANVELVDVPGREFVLMHKLKSLRDAYDYILIDCPPSLELLTLNALVASDTVLVPVQAEFYALEGLSDLTDTIRRINRKMNPALRIEGLVLTMYDGRTKLSTDVEAALREHFPGQVYETTIPRNIRLSEAPSHGMPCLAYDRSSKGARAYLYLANEFLRAQKKGGVRAMGKKSGLGSGLDALFRSEEPAAKRETETTLPIAKVEPRSDQPRKAFDDAALEELTESIRQYGLIQPITVRRIDSGYYQIIAGERRWRAARAAGLTEVPVRILEADDRRAMELALVENLQREDLNPIEEARGYQTLMREYGLTQEETAAAVGKSRPTVANALRLLGLNDATLALVEDGTLSAGHARALLPIRDEKTQQEAARTVVDKRLSVRQTEALAARLSKAPAPVAPGWTISDAVYVREVEKELESVLGRKVHLVNGKKRGKIELEFYGDEDREKLIENLRLFSSLRRNK